MVNNESHVMSISSQTHLTTVDKKDWGNEKVFLQLDLIIDSKEIKLVQYNSHFPFIKLNFSSIVCTQG